MAWQRPVPEFVDHMVEEIAGIRLRRKYNLSAPKGVNGRNSDNTRIEELLGWQPSVRLRQGMEKTYAWIYDEYVARHKAGAVAGRLAPVA